MKKYFPLIGVPVYVLFAGWSIFVFFIGIFGFSDILENLGLWKVAVWFLTGLVILSGFLVLLVIGAVYWLVNTWDWNILLAILFVLPFGGLSIVLLIAMFFGQGIPAMFNVIKNKFFDNR